MSRTRPESYKILLRQSDACKNKNKNKRRGPYKVYLEPEATNRQCPPKSTTHWWSNKIGVTTYVYNHRKY